MTGRWSAARWSAVGDPGAPWAPLPGAGPGYDDAAAELWPGAGPVRPLDVVRLTREPGVVGGGAVEHWFVRDDDGRPARLPRAGALVDHTAWAEATRWAMRHGDDWRALAADCAEGAWWLLLAPLAGVAGRPCVAAARALLAPAVEALRARAPGPAAPACVLLAAVAAWEAGAPAPAASLTRAELRALRGAGGGAEFVGLAARHLALAAREFGPLGRPEAAHVVASHLALVAANAARAVGRAGLADGAEEGEAERAAWAAAGRAQAAALAGSLPLAALLLAVTGGA